MRNLILFIILSNLVVSCSSQSKDFINTKWIYNFEDCQDYFEFKEDGQYVFFSCEADEIVYGDYTVENNFLILEQRKGEFDDEFSSDSRHRTQHLKFKLRIEDGLMRYVERWELNTENKWVKSDFEFDDAYSYKKVD